MVNNHTQINQRPLVQRITDPLLNQEEPPKIRDVNKVFMEKGVELALAAAKKALADWGGNLEDITHLGQSDLRDAFTFLHVLTSSQLTVCNTCTASSYP
jgi:type III polyketide synthase